MCTDERESAAAAVAPESELLAQKISGREVATNNHVRPSSADRGSSSNGGVVNAWTARRGSEGGGGGGGKKWVERDGGKTNGQGPETSTQVCSTHTQ